MYTERYNFFLLPLLTFRMTITSLINTSRRREDGQPEEKIAVYADLWGYMKKKAAGYLIAPE